MTVTLTLPSDVVRLLEEKAVRSGRTLEAYLTQLAEKDIRASIDFSSWEPEISSDDYDRLLDELAVGPPLPRLPAEFSRADIYADHN
jgi:hypothetical protein